MSPYKTVLSAVVVVLAADVTHVPCCLADCVNYESYLRWTGGVTLPAWAKAVAVSDKFAYASWSNDESCGLSVIDITDPANPAIMGSTAKPPGDPGYGLGGVAVSGSHVYVADCWPHLKVFDVSNPRAPTLVGEVHLPGNAFDVAVSGGYAYVGTRMTGLQVIDIADPTSPRVVASAEAGTAFGVAVWGTRLYVAVEEFGLKVFDIADPTHPMLLGSVACGGGDGPLGIAVSGDYAFLTWPELVVIDVSHPAEPTIVGRAPDGMRGVACSGTHVFAGDDYGGLVSFDVSDAANPQRVGIVWAGRVVKVAISDGHAYVADGDGTLHVIDISNPVSSPITGVAGTRGLAKDVAVSGTLACVAEWGYNVGYLETVDVSDPGNPRVVGTLETDMLWGVASTDRYAYLAEFYGPFAVVDLADPENPQIVGSVGNVWAVDVAIAGDYAAVADYGYGLRMIDISDPHTPRIVGDVALYHATEGVAVQGHFAYVTAADCGLQVVDISDPRNPRLAGSLNTDSPPGPRPLSWYDVGIDVSGMYAYVVDDASRLRVVDISDPEHPRLAAIVRVPTMYTGDLPRVTVSEGTAYMPSPPLAVVDVRDPRHPRMEGSLYAGDVEGGGVAVSGSWAYVAAGSHGLQIVSRQCAQTTGAGEIRPLVLPTKLELAACYPNPFGAMTTIRFGLPAPQRTNVAVYSIDGRRVKTLLNAPLAAGRHAIEWDGSDERGAFVGSGTYLYRVEAGSARLTRKVTVVR